MTTYFNERIKLSHRLQGYVNAAGDEIAAFLEGALETVAGKMVTLESKALKAESYTFRKSYLDKLQDEINKVLQDVYGLIGSEIKDKTIELAKAGPEMTWSAFKASMPPTIDFQLSVPVLDTKKVVAWFESSQIEGLYFNDWIKKLQQSAVERVINETRKSLIVKDPARETAKRIQNALDIGRRSAEGLTHNAIHQAQVWADRELFLANEDRLRTFRFTAWLDRRTTPLCRDLDGTEYPPREAPFPPLHWKCRSFLLPVLNNEKLNEYLGTSESNTRIALIDTNPRTVKHRDGTTSTAYQKLRVKKPHADTTYHHWMTSMVKSNDPRDVAFAREVLGPTRFKMVSSGRLRMESLYYHGKLRTIKELKEMI